MTNYNKTQLSPDKEFSRCIFHRDQFAHYLRWTHVLRAAKRGMMVLDVGCGSSNMLEVFYRNRYMPKKYIGVDVRKSQIAKNEQKYKSLKFAKFYTADICSEDFFVSGRFDIITCFEVLEHVGKKNAVQILKNIKKCCDKDTLVLLSTPCYDERVGAAKNHIIDGEVGEFEFKELYDILIKYFHVEEIYGTFASQRDYKHLMNEHQKWMFDELNKYYDTNILSVFFAPMFPEQSRNCLWRLRSQNQKDSAS